MAWRFGDSAPIVAQVAKKHAVSLEDEGQGDGRAENLVEKSWKCGSLRVGRDPKARISMSLAFQTSFHGVSGYLYLCCSTFNLHSAGKWELTFSLFF